MHARTKRSRRQPLALLAVAAMALVALASPAAATTRGPAATDTDRDAAAQSDDGAERHCVAYVQTETSSDKASEPRCWDDASKAEAFVESLTASQAGSRAGGNNVIGRHYSSTSYSGSTITIVGTTCAGGVWKPSGWWNNRISSSSHYCGSSGTRFYNSSTCSGSSKTIYSSASSLGWMNNKTSCVRYG